MIIGKVLVMKIDVAKVVGKTAVSRDGGLKLKSILDVEIRNGTKVELDFQGVQIYASPFFNTAVAPFLGEMKFEKFRSLVSFENISPVGKRLLNQVVHNAIDFYSKEVEEQSDLEEKVSRGLE